MGQSSAFQRSVNLVYSAAIPTQIYGGGYQYFLGQKRTNIVSKSHENCIILQDFHNRSVIVILEFYEYR